MARMVAELFGEAMMNANGKPTGPEWVDSNLFHENRSKIPPEELIQHAGRYAAFTLDGTRIIMSGEYYDDLDAKLLAAGIDPSQVAVSYIGEYVDPARP